MIETIGLVVFASLVASAIIGMFMVGFVETEMPKKFMDAYLQFKEFRQRCREMKLEETSRKRLFLAKMERDIAELRALPLHSVEQIGVVRDTVDESVVVSNHRQQVCA